ncbi:MAG: GntR family transcriptional regulator [Candidatus Omnitrophica bacterium]|nr:GntR family transcriptional regulator [Candidatus Omnitrophota bacterium]
MTAESKYYFHILTSSGVPIYRQIIDQVKMHIATGRLPQDTFLPSVRHVAQELEINPMTVSKAYSILEREGVLESVRGKGMRIKATRQSNKDLKRKEDSIKPLLKQVISRAQQLSLDMKKVTAIFHSLWEEENHE